jgi:hypothetical protein
MPQLYPNFKSCYGQSTKVEVSRRAVDFEISYSYPNFNPNLATVFVKLQLKLGHEVGENYCQVGVELGV